MKKLLLAAMLLLSVGFTALHAQNFPGYRTSNYTGVNGVFFNPANITDSRYRWDVNLFSFNGYIGNNKADFNLKDLSASNTDKFKNNFLQGNGNINGNINSEILGPSAMFNLNKKSSMAISTRFRVIGNLKDFDGNLINSIINAGNATSSFTLGTNSNSQLVTNSWGEYGLSYAREIASFGPHYIKAGITVKYLSGVSHNFLQINKFKTTINADTFSQRAYFQNTSGTIQIANSGLSSGNVNLEKFFGSENKGIGGDIGIVYEYRPDFENAGIDSKNRVKNKYKLKVGLALIDIGSIKYKTNIENSASYNIHISGNQRFYLDQVTNSSIKQLKAKFDANPALFTSIDENSGSYSAGLPTILQGDVDYHLNRGFYVNVGGQLNVVSKSSLYSTNQYNSLTLTPRYEGKFFGIYFPLNYSELTQFNAGISLRAGPLFIGSGSLFTAIAKSKQADLHLGLRVGILHKIKKDASVRHKNSIASPIVAMPADKDGDGIIDTNDKCPDVAGIAKYQGCPIPDTDGDGVNDEEDKCASVKGFVKYKGCPVPDTDSDGVNDEEDKCPTVAGTAKYQGCPIPDTDKDGVNDEEDKCPAVAGPATNMGCPIIEKAIKEKLNFAASHIFFGTGSNKLLAKSFTSLDGVATLLKADQSFKMDIDGFTDNTGKPEKNLELSEQRATAVKTYLISKGVSENNLISAGHGIERPVASNKTAAGRAKNRRVELSVRNF